MAATVTEKGELKVGQQRIKTLKLVRDGGAAMSVAHKYAGGRDFSYARVIKTDGTIVDTRETTPTGLTITDSGGVQSILAEDGILAASNSIYLELVYGAKEFV
jgi:hypothetical protein